MFSKIRHKVTHGTALYNLRTREQGTHVINENQATPSIPVVAQKNKESSNLPKIEAKPTTNKTVEHHSHSDSQSCAHHAEKLLEQWGKEPSDQSWIAVHAEYQHVFGETDKSLSSVLKGNNELALMLFSRAMAHKKRGQNSNARSDFGAIMHHIAENHPLPIIQECRLKALYQHALTYNVYELDLQEIELNTLVKIIDAKLKIATQEKKPVSKELLEMDYQVRLQFVHLSADKRPRFSEKKWCDLYKSQIKNFLDHAVFMYQQNSDDNKHALKLFNAIMTFPHVSKFPEYLDEAQRYVMIITIVNERKSKKPESDEPVVDQVATVAKRMC